MGALDFSDELFERHPFASPSDFKECRRMEFASFSLFRISSVPSGTTKTHTTIGAFGRRASGVAKARLPRLVDTRRSL